MALGAEVEQDSECVQLAKGLVEPQPQKYQQGSEEHFTATAAELLNIYLTLVVTPDSQQGVEKFVADSPLGPGQKQLGGTLQRSYSLSFSG